jgi:Protein of unknown function (DUF1570)
MSRILAVACVAALIAGGPALADLVYFARGGQAQLPATVEGDLVGLDTPDGRLTFPRADFAAIVPEPRPIDDWSARRDVATKDGGVDARFAAAWWALENGLTDQAIAAIEELRPIASATGPTARAIAAIDRLSPPCPDPDLDPLRNRLKPLRFRESRGPHAILFHQHGEAEALERLGLIERVIKTFQVVFAAQGIELPAPERRLVSVYFADHRDYVGFLRRVDGEVFAETQGYYHPILRAVFAFDARSSDEQQAGRRAIANRKVAGESPAELARRALLLDLDWRATDLGILAHETAHQLTTECGLAPRFDDFPTWLHEGIAAQFEVVRGGRWAGFGRANDRRLPDWRSIKPGPRLAPLLRDFGFGRGYRRDLYAESWALVYYLRKTHPREFQAFLDLLRSPRVETIVPRPDRAFEAFRSAFGDDLAGLEADWRRFLDGLKTPLEQGRREAR